MWKIFIIVSCVSMNLVSAADHKPVLGESNTNRRTHLSYSSQMLVSGCLGCGSVVKPFRLDKENTPVLYILGRLIFSATLEELREGISGVLTAIKDWAADDLFNEVAKANPGIVEGTADFSKILETLRKDLSAELVLLSGPSMKINSEQGA
ncbi:MAG: hypothetical protein H6492_01120 [Candidatus Paracaedibacteraceae bacterium]|nr:hypothetical protein [Candidatus Paracaedibacteraceae bacterium]